MGTFFCFIIDEPYVKNIEKAVLHSPLPNGTRLAYLLKQSKTQGKFSQPQICRNICQSGKRSSALPSVKCIITEIKIQQNDQQLEVAWFKITACPAAHHSLCSFWILTDLELPLYIALELKSVRHQGNSKVA